MDTISGKLPSAKFFQDDSRGISKREQPVEKLRIISTGRSLRHREKRSRNICPVLYNAGMNKSALIVMSGLPGSGKSTIAERIAEKLLIPIFSVDPIESAIIEAGVQQGFETGLAAYIVAATLASEQLKLGISVVIDAVNADEEG